MCFPLRFSHPPSFGIKVHISPNEGAVPVAPMAERFGVDWSFQRPAGSAFGLVAFSDELQCDVDDHVLLAAHVAGFPDALQDLVGGDLAALRGPLGVQQEAGVDARVALGDRAAVGEGETVQEKGRTTSAAASAPCTSTPVGMPSRSKVATSTSVVDDFQGRQDEGPRSPAG
jgi:hypothetical protein